MGECCGRQFVQDIEYKDFKVISTLDQGMEITEDEKKFTEFITTFLPNNNIVKDIIKRRITQLNPFSFEIWQNIGSLILSDKGINDDKSFYYGFL